MFATTRLRIERNGRHLHCQLIVSGLWRMRKMRIKKCVEKSGKLGFRWIPVNLLKFMLVAF